MAKVIERNKPSDLDDRSLVDFLSPKRLSANHWVERRARPGYILAIPGLGPAGALLEISGEDENLIAVIAREDEYKILLFDKNAKSKLKRMLRRFKSKEPVLIEKQ